MMRCSASSSKLTPEAAAGIGPFVKTELELVEAVVAGSDAMKKNQVLTAFIKLPLQDAWFRATLDCRLKALVETGQDRDLP